MSNLQNSEIAYSLTTPECEFANGTAAKVDIPGFEGRFGGMPGHAPLISLLLPGVVRIWAEDKSQEIYVEGGFAEVTPTQVTILAETAVDIGDLSVEALGELIKNASENIENAKTDETRRTAQAALEQLRSIQTAPK